jgi:hypothetical protein
MIDSNLLMPFLSIQVWESASFGQSFARNVADLLLLNELANSA